MWIRGNDRRVNQQVADVYNTLDGPLKPTLFEKN